jgi:hypothetical protein
VIASITRAVAARLFETMSNPPTVARWRRTTPSSDRVTWIGVPW